jgi:hypothetical protein
MQEADLRAYHEAQRQAEADHQDYLRKFESDNAKSAYQLNRGKRSKVQPKDAVMDDGHKKPTEIVHKMNTADEDDDDNDDDGISSVLSMSSLAESFATNMMLYQVDSTGNDGAPSHDKQCHEYKKAVERNVGIDQTTYSPAGDWLVVDSQEDTDMDDRKLAGQVSNDSVYLEAAIKDMESHIREGEGIQASMAAVAPPHVESSGFL